MPALGIYSKTTLDKICSLQLPSLTEYTQSQQGVFVKYRFTLFLHQLLSPSWCSTLYYFCLKLLLNSQFYSDWAQWKWLLYMHLFSWFIEHIALQLGLTYIIWTVLTCIYCGFTVYRENFTHISFSTFSPSDLRVNSKLGWLSYV